MTTVAERSESATAKTGYLTAAAMVRDWAKKVPDRIALREKDYGICGRQPGLSIGMS